MKGSKRVQVICHSSKLFKYFQYTNLQKLLKSVYVSTRKDIPFIWTKIHQDAFEEIKNRLLKPPALIEVDCNYSQIQVKLK